MVRKTIFRISQMDCPSEEQMVRMKLEGNRDIRSLEFDIPNRKLTVYHEGQPGNIAAGIHELNLGSQIVETHIAEKYEPNAENQSQKKLLWTVLSINFACFLLEVITGFISRSMGLVADSLDMLADTIVYGLSLLAVGGALTRKKNIARISGYLQIALALVGFSEVIRRFLGYDIPPVFETMIIISLIALTGNAICLWLLQRSNSTEAHMKASLIFTSNDVIINIGVIIAGVLVYVTQSNKPDLIIGSIVFVIVLRGALRILRLSS